MGLQAHQTHMWQMIAASELKLEDPIPLAEPPSNDCSEEECSNKDEIPCPSAEQSVTQLWPSMVPSDTIASTSTCTSIAGAHHLHPGPSLRALTLTFIGCAKKEEPLTSSDEEELLTAHGLVGKISRVGSHIFLNFNLYTLFHKNTSSKRGELITTHFIFQ